MEGHLQDELLYSEGKRGEAPASRLRGHPQPDFRIAEDDPEWQLPPNRQNGRRAIRRSQLCGRLRHKRELGKSGVGRPRQDNNIVHEVQERPGPRRGWQLTASRLSHGEVQERV